VASRAFFVDERHGNALVPLADVFNHKVCAGAFSQSVLIIMGLGTPQLWLEEP
jgi:hypothetical protein